MTFVQMVSAFIGRQVEVVVPNLSFEGDLQAVTTVSLLVKQSPTIYGPGEVVTIPNGVIDYVRVLA